MLCVGRRHDEPADVPRAAGQVVEAVMCPFEDQGTRARSNRTVDDVGAGPPTAPEGTEELGLLGIADRDGIVAARCFGHSSPTRSGIDTRTPPDRR